MLICILIYDISQYITLNLSSRQPVLVMSLTECVQLYTILPLNTHQKHSFLALNLRWENVSILAHRVCETEHIP